MTVKLKRACLTVTPRYLRCSLPESMTRPTFLKKKNLELELYTSFRAQLTLSPGNYNLSCIKGAWVKRKKLFGELTSQCATYPETSVGSRDSRERRGPDDIRNTCAMPTHLQLPTLFLGPSRVVCNRLCNFYELRIRGKCASAH